MNEVIQQIANHEPDAKPVQETFSFQGLSVAYLAPLVTPIIMSWFGLSETDAALVFQYVVGAAGFLWGLYGILRRADVRLPWQKQS